MLPLLILFLVVFFLNVIPAFAPPTWMVFSYVGFRLPTQMGLSFALVGALAAALGRFVLGRLSRTIVRNRWLSESARQNVNAIRAELEKRPKFTIGLFLFYAFTPLPSNYLFIAYGLTTLPLLRIVIPFFVGRFVSYYFWSMGGAAVSRRLDWEDTNALGYLSVYFILTQIGLLVLVYLFTRIDWQLLLYEKRLRWLAKGTR